LITAKRRDLSENWSRRARGTKAWIDDDTDPLASSASSSYIIIINDKIERAGAEEYSGREPTR